MALLSILAVAHQSASPSGSLAESFSGLDATLRRLGLKGDDPNFTAKAKPEKEDPQARKHDFQRLRQKAHRNAFARVLETSEALIEQQDPWAFRRAGHSSLWLTPFSAPPLPALRPLWTKVQNDLQQIDAEQLSSRQVPLLQTLRYHSQKANEAYRTLGLAAHDPHAIPREIESILDTLQWRWIRGHASQDWQMPVEALGRELLKHPRLPATATPTSCAHALARAQALLRQIDRFEGSIAPHIPSWRPPLSELNTALQHWTIALQKATRKLQRHPPLGANEKLPVRAVGQHITPRAFDLNAPLFRHWEQEQSNTQISLKAALAGIENTSRRFAAMKKKYDPFALPMQIKSVRPDVKACEDLQRRLVDEVRRDPRLEAQPLHCNRLIPIKKPQHLAELSQLLVEGAIIRPSREPFRKAQRTMVSSTENTDSASIHVLLRTVMILATLDLQRQSHYAQALHRSLDQLQGHLCRAHIVLRQNLAPQRPPLSPACPPKTSKSALGDPFGALSGVLVGQLPDAPYKMAAIDRYYWAPPGLALTWAAPPAPPPTHRPNPAQNAPTNLKVTWLSGPQAHHEPAPDPAPSESQ